MTTEASSPEPAGASEAEPDQTFAEARWPMASAVVVAMVLTALMPDRLRLGPRLLLPVIAGLLLIAQIIGDPGRIDRASVRLRRLSISLVGVLVLGAAWATFQLTDEIIHGGPDTATAGPLLQAGAVVWISGILAFSLLYFELDCGGAAARAHSMPKVPDLAYPQQLNPALGGENWRPHFIDYLYLGLTNSLAFSPTDVMPLAPWAKIAMALQSLVSLGVLGLVIARAINVLPN